MTEKELLDLWNRSRMQLIVAQLAPTFLLITTVSLVTQIREAGTYAVCATLGILIASGILGALAEFSAANEAQAIAADLAKLANPSRLATNVVKNAVWLHVAKYVTPTIFVGIFVALVLALI
ncbi:MAG: hypothetical protein RLZ71_31 [Actinomycetota bacterium]|jgi:hypothetical protein